MADQPWGTGKSQSWHDLFAEGGTWGDYGRSLDGPPGTGSEGGGSGGPFKYYAFDLFTRKVVDEVPFSTFKYSQTINRAGGWSATINALHPKADPAVFSKGRTAIVVVDRGEPRFAGMIWSISETPDGTLNVGGTEVWDYFSRRMMRTATGIGPFVQVDQFNIVKTLLTTAQSGVRESVGLTVRYPRLSGVLRDRVYDPAERKPYAQAIQELAEVENGFEFKIAPQWSNGQLIFYMDLAYPRLGRDTDMVWFLGPSVTLAGNYEDNGGDRANLVDTIGSGSGSTKLIAFAINPPVDTLRLETSVSYTDVKVLATLVDHANGELARVDQDQQSMKVRILDLAQFGLGTWSLGDSVWVARNRKPNEASHYHDIDDRYRIQGFDASVNVDGQLEVTADLVLGVNNLSRPRPTLKQRAAAQQAALEKRLTQLEKVG